METTIQGLGFMFPLSRQQSKPIMEKNMENKMEAGEYIQGLLGFIVPLNSIEYGFGVYYTKIPIHPIFYLAEGGLQGLGVFTPENDKYDGT